MGNNYLPKELQEYLRENMTNFMEILGHGSGNQLLILMAECKKEVDVIRPIIDKWRDSRKAFPMIIVDKSDIEKVNKHISNLKIKIPSFDSFVINEKNEELKKNMVAHCCNLKKFITDTESLVNAIMKGGIVVDR